LVTVRYGCCDVLRRYLKIDRFSLSCFSALRALRALREVS